MGYRKSRILSLVILFLCGYLLVNLVIIPDYVYTSSHNITDEITLVLSNRLSSSNSSWQSSVPFDDLPANDSSQLINITDFKFLINVPCSESLYIVCVHSAPKNQIKRHLIRKTWGAHVPLYFMLGETSPEEQRLLDAESSEFRDIVQGRFHDSYANLTYKHTMIFKWVIYHCPHVKYVLKCDDDIFVNVIKLNDFLLDTLSPYGTRNLLMCADVYYYALVQRGYRRKWRVSFKEYSERYYPPYCTGSVNLYSPDMMFKLYQVLQKEQKYYWVDDVFVTGMVFANLNVTHSNFNWWQRDGKSLIDINSKDNLLKYDPHINMFAYFTFLNNPRIQKLYQYVSNVTFLSSNSTFSYEELVVSENIFNF